MTNINRLYESNNIVNKFVSEWINYKQPESDSDLYLVHMIEGIEEAVEIYSINSIEEGKLRLKTIRENTDNKYISSDSYSDYKLVVSLKGTSGFSQYYFLLNIDRNYIGAYDREEDRYHVSKRKEK